MDTRRTILIPISESMLSLAVRFAKAACLGGQSSIRAGDRMEKLLEDQTVGQLGQMALAVWKDGHIGEYLMQRAAANNYPTHGDGGADLIGSNIDVKTSLMRGSDDPMQYRLAVRPAEMHDGWVYMLAVVPQQMDAVHLVGWATSTDMQARPPEDAGHFMGARTLFADELRPLPPIDWSGRWGLS
jgi:hypothetical protein